MMSSMSQLLKRFEFELSNTTRAPAALGGNCYVRKYGYLI